MKGKGSTVRHIVLDSAKSLAEPAVRDLMDQALKLAEPPLHASQKHRILIKSISAKQRPRRPAKA